MHRRGNVIATLATAAALPLLATPTSADKSPNADTVDAMLGALVGHNPFTVRDPETNTTFAIINTGPYGFYVGVTNNDKEQRLDCVFAYYDRDADGKTPTETKVSYVGYGCIGDLHGVSVGDTAQRPPTADDYRAYKGFLGFLAKLVPAMQAYKSHVEEPSGHALVPDLALREKNRALMETILHEIEVTKVTTFRDGERIIAFSGTHSTAVGLNASISENHYTSCVLYMRSREGASGFFDEGCDGSVVSYRIGGNGTKLIRGTWRLNYMRHLSPLSA